MRRRDGLPAPPDRRPISYFSEFHHRWWRYDRLHRPPLLHDCRPELAGIPRRKNGPASLSRTPRRAVRTPRACGIEGWTSVDRSRSLRSGRSAGPGSRPCFAASRLARGRPRDIGIRCTLRADVGTFTGRIEPIGMIRISEVGIGGNSPDLFASPASCGYFAGCPYVMRACKADLPAPFGLHADHHGCCRLHQENRDADAADVYRKAVGTA